MRKIIGIAAAVGSAVLSTACGQAGAEDAGPQISRTVQVAAFDKIEVSGPFEVEVRTGALSGVTISGPEKAITEMVVEVRGGRLVIAPPPKARSWRWNGGPIKVSVTAPAVVAAKIAGSGDVRIDRISGSNFDGGIEGSGEMLLREIDVRALNLAIGGSGTLKAGTGRAGSINLNIAGSGDIDTKGVTAETGSASIAGSGNIEANVARTASINIMGSGDVHISGGAKCTVNNAGSGSFRCS